VQKHFGWLGGYGLAGTGAAFEQMGFHPASVFHRVDDTPGVNLRIDVARCT
jgi:hypothetical protein